MKSVSQYAEKIFPRNVTTWADANQLEDKLHGLTPLKQTLQEKVSSPSYPLHAWDTHTHHMTAHVGFTLFTGYITLVDTHTHFC